MERDTDSAVFLIYSQSELCVTRFAETPQMAPSSFGFGLTVETPYTSEVNSINYRVFGPVREECLH